MTKLTLDDAIDELQLTVRAANCLKSAGVYTLRNLVKVDEEFLREIPNLGKKSFVAIREELEKAGFYFGYQEPKEPSLTEDIKIALETLAREVNNITAKAELSEIKISRTFPEVIRRIEMLEATYNKMSGLYEQIYAIKDKLEKLDRLYDHNFLEALHKFSLALQKAHIG